MSFTTSSSRPASPDIVNRRLAAGVLLSIILHAMLLALQFGVPGLGLPAPSRPQPVTITLAPPEPAPQAIAPEAVAELPPPAPEAPSGMRVLAPTPAPAPAAPVAAKPKRVKPRRISRPLPPSEPVDSPTRVIAQDQNPNDTFVVPLPQPEEAAQKTVDPKEAQEGTDDGADARAALVAEEQRKEELAAQAKADLEKQRARESAAIQAEETRRKLAEAEKIQEQERKQQADQLAAKQQADQLVARQQADQLAAQQQADQLVAKQQADQLAAKQRLDDLARKQAEELALKQKADELATRQRAADLARQAEAARQQAEQVARQQAEQAAQNQAAEQAAKQQAEQAAAAAQRERERVAAATPAAAAGASGAGSGGTGATIPKNLLGSDAGNRARELTRGIDLLSGAPPQRPRGDAERGGRRAVVGSAERDVPLRMYVDSFRQKIERNGGLMVSPMAGERVRIDPLVSVAIRSDGSVEEVTIVRSSGHASVDDAVRRIVRINARFSAFPPNIASRYDVIEIRRIWSFAESLKLLEELR